MPLAVCSLDEMTGDDENTRAGFLAKLESQDVGANRRQLELVNRLLDFFAQRGVISGGHALPLFEACANRCDCWRSFEETAYPSRVEGSVSVPVGRK